METKIEMMQEMISKDLKELKNKQMNNTLEEINNRITNANNWTRGQNAGNHNYRREYKKKIERMKTASETSGTTLNT